MNPAAVAAIDPLLVLRRDLCGASPTTAMDELMSFYGSVVGEAMLRGLAQHQRRK